MPRSCCVLRPPLSARPHSHSHSHSHDRYCSLQTERRSTEPRVASSDMPVNLSALVFVLFLLLACQQVLTVDPHDVQEKQASQAKRRLSLQSTGELEETCSYQGCPDVSNFSGELVTLK